MRSLPFLSAALAMMGLPALAAPQAWTGGSTANGNWTTGANWGGTPVPGSTSGTTNADTATFNAAIANTWGNAAGNPIVIDSTTENIGSINFTLVAGNYFVGSTSGHSLFLSSSGSIGIDSSLTSTNATETVNAPLILEGNYAFSNNSANGTGTGAGTLDFGGGITGVAASGTTLLTLSGSNTNANTISGVIGNGSGGGKVGLTKSGAGVWDLTGTNSFTGGMAITGGTLGFNTQANLNSTNAISISNGATLQWDQAASFGSGAVNFANSISLGTGGGQLAGNGDMILNSTVTGGTGLTLTTASSASSADFIWTPGSTSTAGPVTLTGSGTRLLLGSQNLLTNGATLSVTNGANLDFNIGGSWSEAITMASGTILTSRNTPTLTNLLLPGSGNITIGGDDSGGSGTVTISKAQTLTGNLTIGVTSGSGASNISGAIGGTGNLTIAGSTNTGAWGKNNTAGDFVLSGKNTFNGSLTLNLPGFNWLEIAGDSSGIGNTINIQSGFLYLLSTGKLPTAANITIGSSTAQGYLGLGDTSGTAGVTQTIASLTAGSAGGTLVNSGNTSGSSLTINNTVSDTYTGNMGGSGSNQNNVALTKSGVGDFIMKGVNTLSLGLTINGGAFYADSTAATGTGAVAVASGGTLRGNGSIAPGAGNAITIADGGNLNAGEKSNSGTPTVANGFLTITAASTSAAPVLKLTAPTHSTDPAQLTFDLGNGPAPVVAGLTLVGSSSYLDFTVNDPGEVVFSTTTPNLVHIDALPGGLVPGDYLLMEAPSASDYANLQLTGNVITGGLALDAASAGWGQLQLINGDIVLDMIPEPSTNALLLFGGAGFLIFLSRRVRLA